MYPQQIHEYLGKFFKESKLPRKKELLQMISTEIEVAPFFSYLSFKNSRMDIFWRHLGSL